ncbi:hypothetical protein AX14_007120 [Amanita brunnescens Koide BX004]|nr:hypothetical protein AX14_007120 [Amanita brunnescens Koide BX004]
MSWRPSLGSCLLTITMAPHLRVLAGPCPSTLVPITTIVNTNATHKVSSELFQGEITVHVKDFADEEGVVRQSDYFQREDRQGVTWSIQVCGRFLEAYSADDILFGNVFDRPLYLPWGSSFVLKFMKYIDPSLEHDLCSQSKPWALSPLIATMPHFAHRRVESDSGGNRPLDLGSQSHHWNDFTGELYQASIKQVSSSDSSVSSISPVIQKSDLSPDDVDSLLYANVQPVIVKKRRKRAAPKTDFQFDTAAERRSYFGKAKHRQAIQFGPNVCGFLAIVHVSY